MTIGVTNMRVNSFRMTYPIIFGIPLTYVLYFGLGAFFVKQFFIDSYDPAAYILLFMLIGFLVVTTVPLVKYQFFHRCFLRFRMDNDGLEWYFFRSHSQRLKWSEVRTYGVTGYDRKHQPEAFVFFSMDPNERCDTKQKMCFGKHRVVIQIREESLCALEQYLPPEMRKAIVAIEKRQDCFYKR